MHLYARCVVRTLFLLGCAALLPVASGLAAETGAAAPRGTHTHHAHHTHPIHHTHPSRGRRVRHPAPAPGRRDAQARERLRALQARMAAMSAQNSRDARARERLTDELRTAELSLSRQRAALAQTDQALAAQQAHREALAAERARQAHDLDAARAGLAEEIRAAYLLDRQGPLQLLLNQKNPLASARLLAYYGYFSRAGAGRIERISADVQQLDSLDAELAE